MPRTFSFGRQGHGRRMEQVIGGEGHIGGFHYSYSGRRSNGSWRRRWYYRYHDLWLLLFLRTSFHFRMLLLLLQPKELVHIIEQHHLECAICSRGLFHGPANGVNVRPRMSFFIIGSTAVAPNDQFGAKLYIVQGQWCLLVLGPVRHAGPGGRGTLSSTAMRLLGVLLMGGRTLLLRRLQRRTHGAARRKNIVLAGAVVTRRLYLMLVE